MADAIQIDSFPNDNNLWRIDLIDFISNSPDDEVRVGVYLSKLKSNINDKDVLLNDSLYLDESDEPCSFNIIVRSSLIRYIKVGTVWLNGLLQPNYRGFETSIIISSDDPIKLVPLTKLGKTSLLSDSGEWDDIWTDKHYKMAKPEIKKGIWVNVILSESEYKRIVIPSSVIFQSAYVPCEKAINYILYGQLDKIVNLEKSGFLENDCNIFRVHLRKEFKNEHAPLIASLITDDAALDNINILRKHIQYHSVRESGEIPLKVGFPFSKDVGLKVIGKTFYFNEKDLETGKSEKKKGFFVTEIKSISPTLEFKKLIVDRDNNNKPSDNKDDELKPAYSGYKQKKENDLDSAILDFDAHNSPSNLMSGTNFEDDIIFNADELELISSESKDFQAYISQSYISASTIELNTDKLGVGKQESKGKTIPVDEEGGEQIPPVSYGDFIEIIEKLKTKNIKLETLKIQNYQYIKGNYINRFNNKIPRMRSWHKIGNRTKTYIIAEVYTKGFFKYLIYIEAKGQDALSCCVLNHYSGSRIQTDSFIKFMTRTAQSNGWSVFEKHPELFSNWRHEYAKFDRNNNDKTVTKILQYI